MSIYIYIYIYMYTYACARLHIHMEKSILYVYTSGCSFFATVAAVVLTVQQMPAPHLQHLYGHMSMYLYLSEKFACTYVHSCMYYPFLESQANEQINNQIKFAHNYLYSSALPCEGRTVPSCRRNPHPDRGSQVAGSVSLHFEPV